MRKKIVSILSLIALMFGTVLLIEPANVRAQTLPNETPDKVTPTNDGFDYVRREVMIPMRDGVKLHTVILVPKGATRAPILLTRTPPNSPRTSTVRTSAPACMATTMPPT